jgi:hypothetical protein
MDEGVICAPYHNAAVQQQHDAAAASSACRNLLLLGAVLQSGRKHNRQLQERVIGMRHYVYMS